MADKWTINCPIPVACFRCDVAFQRKQTDSSSWRGDPGGDLSWRVLERPAPVCSEVSLPPSERERERDSLPGDKAAGACSSPLTPPDAEACNLWTLLHAFRRLHDALRTVTTFPFVFYYVFQRHFRSRQSVLVRDVFVSWNPVAQRNLEIIFQHSFKTFHETWDNEIHCSEHWKWR